MLCLGLAVGNCIGIPTVAETKFDETYNILVNAMAVSHAKKNKIFYSKAKGLNKSVVYVGSKIRWNTWGIDGFG